MEGTMKTLTIFTFCFLLSLIIFSPGNALAQNNFFDVFSFGVKGAGQDKTINSRMYNAQTTLAWRDTNQNGKLDQNETLSQPLKIFDRHGNLAVVSPNGLNSTQLEEFAIKNSKAILAAIFGSGVSESTGESQDGIMASISLGSKLQKAKPSKTKSDVQGFIINNDFKGVLEYLFLDVNHNNGGAASIYLDYNHTFNSGFQLSMNLPYRYTVINDDINSKSHFLGLELSGKYPVINRDSFVWDVGADIFGSAYYLTSDAIAHMGDLKYGAGVFTAITKKFKFATLSVGTDFRVSDRTVPSSWIDTNNEFVAQVIDYLNSLGVVKTLSYGFNLGVPFANEKAAINLEVIRSTFFNDNIENDRKFQTTAGLTLSYYPTNTFELSLGVRKTFELQDINVTGVYFGATYRY